MIKQLLLGGILASSLLASSHNIDYDFLKDKPDGRAKDFYSLLFLEQTKNRVDAQKIFYQLKKPKSKHIKYLQEITEDKSLVEYKRCSSLKPEELLYEDLECSILGYSLGKASNLSNSDKLLLSLKYKKAMPSASKTLFFMSSKKTFTSKKMKDAMKVFVNAGSKHRENSLDIKLSKEFLDSLESSYYLNKSVEYAALSHNLENFSDSILEVDVNTLSGKAAFFYSMLALRNLDEKRAVEGLERAKKQFTRQKNLDKTNFWLWLITGSKEFAKELEKSESINFYTLVFREKNDLQSLPFKTEAPDIKGAKKLSKENISDPFFWSGLLEKIRNTKKEESKKLLYDLGGQEAEPFRAVVYSHMSSYRENYFIHPWKAQLKSLDLEYQALVLSLARQESLFIPSALSRSYAIGAMQMMPFLIKHIGKENKDSVFLPDFFSTSKILPYAIQHIDSLRKNFKQHPLLIAYAYNGGGGFTRRKVLSKLFKGGKYDPFLSMELVPYAESREYGKKVLTNYYIYRKILKIPTTFERMFRKLK